MTLKVDIVPDAQYDPTFQPVITGRTRLAQSITMSKFLGTYNDPQSISHLTNKDKLLLLKYKMATVVGIVVIGFMLFCVGVFACFLLGAKLIESDQRRRVSPWG